MRITEIQPLLAVLIGNLLIKRWTMRGRCRVVRFRAIDNSDQTFLLQAQANRFERFLSVAVAGREKSPYIFIDRLALSLGEFGEPLGGFWLNLFKNWVHCSHPTALIISEYSTRPSIRLLVNLWRRLEGRTGQ